MLQLLSYGTFYACQRRSPDVPRRRVSHLTIGGNLPWQDTLRRTRTKFSHRTGESTHPNIQYMQLYGDGASIPWMNLQCGGRAGDPRRRRLRAAAFPPNGPTSGTTRHNLNAQGRAAAATTARSNFASTLQLMGRELVSTTHTTH